MEKYSTKLGWALAHLQAKGIRSAADQSGPDRDYLNHMQARYRELSHNGKSTVIVRQLPACPCLIDKPFLENNEDFFITLFSDIEHEEVCARLYKHMNDCYPCFEIFSQVLRDYYQQGETLQEFNGEKQHG